MICQDRSVWRIAEPVSRAISVHGAESAKRSERSEPKSLGKVAEQFGTHGDRSQIMEEEAQSIQIEAEGGPTAKII